MLDILLAVLAAVLFGISVILQKYSMKKMKKFEVKALVKNKKWLFALFIGILGVLAYISAMSVGDISTVQPILSLSLIIPVIFGFFWFKEEVVISRWFFIVLLLVGVILLSLY